MDGRCFLRVGGTGDDPGGRRDPKTSPTAFNVLRPGFARLNAVTMTGIPPQESRPMIQRFDTGPRMSKIVIHHGVAYLAGQVPQDANADIAGQTEQVLHAIDDLLQRAATDKAHILRADIFLADMADFDGMNEVWERWVPQGAAPARATVQARLARPNLKIEIVIIAAVP
jgi:enamine deaminase RidA (YjgF/YER057c/UK114 family)